jgi:hypothetical protein
MEQEDKARLEQLGKDRRLAEALSAAEAATLELIRVGDDPNATEDDVLQAAADFRAAVERRNKAYHASGGVTGKPIDEDLLHVVVDSTLEARSSSRKLPDRLSCLPSTSRRPALGFPAGRLLFRLGSRHGTRRRPSRQALYLLRRAKGSAGLRLRVWSLQVAMQGVSACRTAGPKWAERLSPLRRLSPPCGPLWLLPGGDHRIAPDGA